MRQAGRGGAKEAREEDPQLLPPSLATYFSPPPWLSWATPCHARGGSPPLPSSYADRSCSEQVEDTSRVVTCLASTCWAVAAPTSSSTADLLRTRGGGILHCWRAAARPLYPVAGRALPRVGLRLLILSTLVPLYYLLPDQNCLDLFQIQIHLKVPI